MYTGIWDTIRGILVCESPPNWPILYQSIITLFFSFLAWEHFFFDFQAKPTPAIAPFYQELIDKPWPWILSQMSQNPFRFISGWWFGTMEFWMTFHINWEFHHPNWLIFFRGVGQPPTSHSYKTPPKRNHDFVGDFLWDGIRLETLNWKKHVQVGGALAVTWWFQAHKLGYWVPFRTNYTILYLVTPS